jgi:hypothetical protein
MIKKFTAFAICFMGSQIATSAIAGLPNQGVTSTNQLRLPGNIVQLAQQTGCQIRGGVGTPGAELRDNPSNNSKNIGFFNNGTNVTVQGRTADGNWLSVTGPNAQGWVWSAYVTGNNCNTNNIIGGGNVTNPGTGRLCTVVPSPGFPNIDMRAQPRAESPLVGQPLAAGTQVREVPAPPGLTSERKWMYVQSVVQNQNPNQVGWVWRNYLQCQ